jgi:hypothetical protein
MGAALIGSLVLLLLALAMGAAFLWDIRGFATRMRVRLEAREFDGGLYRRLPPWTFRAAGIWCIVFGVGQLAFVWSVTH